MPLTVKPVLLLSSIFLRCTCILVGATGRQHTIVCVVPLHGYPVCVTPTLQSSARQCLALHQSGPQFCLCHYSGTGKVAPPFCSGITDLGKPVLKKCKKQFPIYCLGESNKYLIWSDVIFFLSQAGLGAGPPKKNYEISCHCPFKKIQDKKSSEKTYLYQITSVSILLRYNSEF